jgi:dsDNA-specific endonuclease/ATPase MutS2
MVEKDFFLKGAIARDLDFYRIREKISQLTISEEGKEELLKREASSDLEQIKFWKKLGREWNKILNSNSVVNLKPWPQVNDLFIHLKVQGSQLLQEQIFALGLFCISSESARENLNSAAINLSLPNIKKTVGEMESLQEAKNLIFSPCLIDKAERIC